MENGGHGALSLPCFTVDLREDRPRVRTQTDASSLPTQPFRPGELTWLVSIDEPVPHVGWTVERLVPLVDQRWAVARRTGPTTIWRVVDGAASSRVGHPAWLWVSDDWLDPHQASQNGLAVPARLPLRSLVQQAGPLHTSKRHIIKALSATVRLLRGGLPVAVVVSKDALTNALHPARFFGLALMDLLPPGWRSTLRISIGDPKPAPGAWNVVITDHAPPGYRAVSIDDPQDEGADLVAYYIRERLLADDPEALEATTFQVAPTPSDQRPGATTQDPWSEAVAAVLRNPPAGVATVDDEALEADPERAIRGLTARLSAGALLDEPLLERLVRITTATRDPRPWLALRQRSAVQRSTAVNAILAKRESLHPTDELVQVLAAVYPRGAPLNPWITALLTWLHQGNASTAVQAAVQTTLLEWPLTATHATRASVWSEVVYGLVALGEDDAAMESLVSEVAQHIAADGASRALVANWSIVPAAFRDPERLERLVRLIAHAPDANDAIVDLFLHARERPNEVPLICKAWLAERVDVLTDPLFASLSTSSFMHSWFNALFATHSSAQALKKISSMFPNPSDPQWVHAEAAMTRHLALGPANRFQSLSVLGPGIDALAPHAPVWLLDALPRPFPAPELVGVARMLLGSTAPSPLWDLVAVMAAPVDQWDDTTIDSAVVDFCSNDHDPAVREAALMCAEQLGAAEGFEALDHARWLVRISLTPDATRITPDLALAVVGGIQSRPDSLEHMVAVTVELLELPPEHPALLAFVHFLLPQAWHDGPPVPFREAIPVSGVPEPLQLAWARAYGETTQPC